MKTVIILIVVCVCWTFAHDLQGDDFEKYLHPNKHPEVKVKTRIIEQKIPVPYTVEKRVPYTVYKKVPYKVRVPVPHPYVVEKKVPYPVKEYVKVPYYVPKPYEVIKKVPYEVKVPVPRPVEVKIPVPKPYIVEKKVPKPFKVYVPQPYTVEKRVPYPVKVLVPVPQPYTVEKKVPYEVKIPVERPYVVHVPKPYKVHFEEHVPVPVERPVPYEVPHPVEAPKPIPVTYPTENKPEQQNSNAPQAAALTSNAQEGWKQFSSPYTQQFGGYQGYQGSAQQGQQGFTLSTKLNVGNQNNAGGFAPSQPNSQYDQQMFEQLPQYYGQQNYPQLSGYKNYNYPEFQFQSGQENFVQPSEAQSFTQADATQNNQVGNGQAQNSAQTFNQAQNNGQAQNANVQNFPQGAQNFAPPQNYATQDQPQSDFEPFQQSVQQMQAGLVQSTFQQNAQDLQQKSNYSHHNHAGLGQFSEENGDVPKFEALVQQADFETSTSKPNEANQQQQNAHDQQQSVLNQQQQNALNQQHGEAPQGYEYAPQSQQQQYEQDGDVDYSQYGYDDGGAQQYSDDYYFAQNHNVYEQIYAQAPQKAQNTRHMNPKGQVYNAHGGGGDKTQVVKYTNIVVHPKAQKDAQKQHKYSHEIKRKQDNMYHHHPRHGKQHRPHYEARHAPQKYHDYGGVEYSDGVLIQNKRAPKSIHQNMASFNTNGWTPMDITDLNFPME